MVGWAELLRTTCPYKLKCFEWAEVLRHIFEFRALITEIWIGNIYTKDETFDPTEDFMTTTRKDKSDDACTQLAAGYATVSAKFLA